MSITCRACGQENPDGFRICGMCGTPLAGVTVRRQERKTVTVLFCDLVGFTARAERLDPEDVQAILAPYPALACGTISNAMAGPSRSSSATP